MTTLTNQFGTFLLPHDGGDPIYFDAVLTEQITRDAEITEFPVETGANITDHYRIRLNTIRLEVFVSQEPLFPAIHPEGGGFYGAQQISWKPYPTPGLDINGNPVIGTQVANVIGAAINPVGTLMKLLNQDPTSATLNGVLQWANEFDSLVTLMNALEKLRKTAALIDVCTKSLYYSSYLLGQIETNRDASTGSGTRVTMELHQVNQVATQTTDAPQIPSLPLKPPDKPKVNKGPQQPTDPGQMQSFASAAVASAKAYLAGPH